MAKTSCSGACFSPHLYPRPAYPPLWPVLKRTVCFYLRFGTLACFCAWVTTPLHVHTRKCFDRYMQTWTSHESTENIFSLTPWVTTADLFFCFVFSTALCSVYVLVNGFFWLCDEYCWLQRYKCPRTAAQQPGAKLISSTIKKELFAHFVTAPLIMVFVLGPLVRRLNPESSRPNGIPSVHIMFVQFLVCLFINQVLFYWGHRMLHTPWLYRNVHKQHHMYIATRSFAAGRPHKSDYDVLSFHPLLHWMSRVTQ